MSRLLAFGLGYSAQALGRLKLKSGWSVVGTARTPDGVKALNAQGFEGVLFDGMSVLDARADQVKQATHVVVSIPPQEAGDPVLGLLRNAMGSSGRLSWIGYLSTVGVYGNSNGGWVDEESPVAPDFDRTRWRISAEQDWLDFGRHSGKRVQVFRLAGIYGPGRSAFDSILSGRARCIIKPGQVFNRIHVDDIARIVSAAMDGRGRSPIYNVADDEPAPPQDVICFAADLMGLPAPADVPFQEADLSPMARSFYMSNRRVSNAKAKSELGVRLLYPNYRDGLKAICSLSS